ncbi:hypothetical protein DRN69_03505 [Candidatus Pacearchaeota archaeon]|nr:MAG: hypothetical protein DRN69_03505 [Candidatus Pacearchaeota archaeon]
MKIMVQDVMLTSRKGEIGVRFSKEFVRNISKEIASKIAEELFYEGLFFRFLPEIKGIEEEKIKAKRGKEAIEFLEKMSKNYPK